MGWTSRRRANALCLRALVKENSSNHDDIAPIGQAPGNLALSYEKALSSELPSTRPLNFTIPQAMEGYTYSPQNPFVRYLDSWGSAMPTVVTYI